MTRTVVIGGISATVDSLLEERVIRHLDSNGFHGLWDKPLVGLNVGDSNYTPDIELSVQMDGMTHRAIVEIKPAKRFLTSNILRRMIAIAGYYHSHMLLLYADKEKSWYRIDVKTSAVLPCAPPTPGSIPIAKLYKPASLPSRSVYNHAYTKAALPTMGNAFIEFLIALIAAPFGSSSQPRRRKRRY